MTFSSADPQLSDNINPMVPFTRQQRQPLDLMPARHFQIELLKISGREWKHIFAGFKEDFLVEGETMQTGVRLTTCRHGAKRKEALDFLLDFAARQLRTVSQPPAARHTHMHPDQQNVITIIENVTTNNWQLPTSRQRSLSISHSATDQHAALLMKDVEPLSHNKRRAGLFSSRFFLARITHHDGKLKCQN